MVTCAKTNSATAQPCAVCSTPTAPFFYDPELSGHLCNPCLTALYGAGVIVSAVVVRREERKAA